MPIFLFYFIMVMPTDLFALTQISFIVFMDREFFAKEQYWPWFATLKLKVLTITPLCWFIQKVFQLVCKLLVIMVTACRSFRLFFLAIWMWNSICVFLPVSLVLSALSINFRNKNRKPFTYLNNSNNLVHCCLCEWGV